VVSDGSFQLPLTTYLQSQVLRPRDFLREADQGGRFVTELDVNEAGFVTHYPGFWQVEDAA